MSSKESSNFGLKKDSLASMKPIAPGISSVNISDVTGVRNDRFVTHDSLDQLFS